MSFLERLHTEVVDAYTYRGTSFGNERFSSWQRRFSKFLKENLPDEVTTLEAKLNHIVYTVRPRESELARFMREDGENMISYIESLILDIRNDEYDIPDQKTNLKESAGMTDRTSVFIVHGHNSEAKERTARFIEKLDLKAIILHEQASRGQTIIEKIEKHTDVGFAIVLYTPDDMGNVKSEAEGGNLKLRARQNVVFEHGFLAGKIGRENVIPLVSGDLELPSDISGIVYISERNWETDIAKEMKAAGYDIDLNKLL